MIQRRASEIIRLALAMSQTNNTDALSWKDKIDMLNQSYIRLYTDLNNSGDLYYSKEMKLEPLEGGHNLKYRLPKDFWKLLEIGYMSLGHFKPMLRSPNSGGDFSGYRIINNELVMDIKFADLAIKYIPAPQYITFPRQGYGIPGSYQQAHYDSSKDVIILGGPGTVTVINNTSGKSYSADITETDGENAVIVPFALAVSDDIIYVVKENKIEIYDYALFKFNELLGNFDIYAHSIGWETGIIIKIDGVPYKYRNQGVPEKSADYWNYLDGKIVRTGNNFVFSDDIETKDISFMFTGDSFVIADPFVYKNENGLINVYDNFEPMNMSPASIGRGSLKGMIIGAEINHDTGFGSVFVDFHSGLSLTGFAADTVMNYPSNIFFDWLTADLAVKFRIALDIPTGELPSLAADYHDTLMRSISRDAFQSQRINNVYG